MEAVLADLAPQQLVPRALEARPGPGPQPPVCGPCSRWPRFRWSRAAKLRTSAASIGSSAAAWYTRDTGTWESTTRGELVEWRMSCGGNRLGRTHAGRKLLQKLKKRALSTLGRWTYLNRLMGEHACQTPCRELLIPLRGQGRGTRVNWTLLRGHPSRG